MWYIVFSTAKTNTVVGVTHSGKKITHYTKVNSQFPTGRGIKCEENTALKIIELLELVVHTERA